MANILDFLATKSPQNFVQPMEIQPSYGDIYAGTPTQVPVNPAIPVQEPYYPSTNIAQDIRALDRAGGEALQGAVANILTPTVAPMQSGEAVATPNPYTSSPQTKPTASQMPSMLNFKLASSKYPFASEADSAVNLAGKAAAEFAKNAPIRPIDVGDYNAPVVQVEKNVGNLENEIKTYETETQNLLNEHNKATEDYIKGYQQTTQDFVTRAQDLGKKISEFADQKIDTTIDPGKLWKNASTGSKVLFAISSIFAAMTPQTAKGASDALMKAIDSDIDAQKESALNKFRERANKMDALRDEFTRAKEITGSDLAAREVMRAQKLNMVSTMLQQKASTLTNKQTLMNAQNAVSTLQMEALKSKQAATNAAIEHNDRLAQIQLDSKQKQAEFMLAKAKLKSDERIAGAGQGIGMALPQLTIEENIRMGAVPKEQRNEAIKEAGLAKATSIMLGGADTYYDRVKADIEETGFGGGRIMQALPFTKSGTYRDLGATLIWQPASQLAQGVLQQHEFDALVKPFLPKSWDTLTQLETKRSGLKNAIASFMAGKMPTLATYGIDVSKQYPEINKAIISPKGKL